jgi:uncharacterized protein YkwD
MTFLLVALLSAAPSDEALQRAVAARFEAAGRQTPPQEPELERAARAIARHALGAGVIDAAGLLRVTAAISRAGGWDPNPLAVLVRAPSDELIATLARQVSTDEPVTAMGTALVLEGDRGAAVALLARRRMQLFPFARRHTAPPSAPQRLCGKLLPPLATADVFVTRPSGDVDSTPMTPAAQGLCAPLTFPTPGRHAVEVLARGPRGPEVAALFFVEVGAVGDTDDELMVEPSTPMDARAQLLARINALRLRMGLAPLQADPALDAVAQAWAARLASEGFFSHVAPDGSDLKSRLTTAGYRFASAGENLGTSSGPLAAHFGIEHSPGHRKNLIEPGHRRLGIGLAQRPDGLTVLVEVLATPADALDASGDPLKAAYDAISTARARKGLPPLKPNLALEALAQGHARAALAAQIPKADIPGQAPLHDRAFSLVDEAMSVSVDVFVADSPTSIIDSKNLAEPRNALVGVGMAKGSSRKYGGDRYWIVVIYAATR